MTRMIVDSGALSHLASRRKRGPALVHQGTEYEDWAQIVPSVVLVECLQGKPHTDVLIDRFVKSCELRDRLPHPLARRAATLRAKAGTGSAVDAIVVAMAEPGGTVLTTDRKDFLALAAHAYNVQVLAP